MNIATGQQMNETTKAVPYIAWYNFMLVSFTRWVKYTPTIRALQEQDIVK